MNDSFNRRDTEWLHNARWGVMFHYLDHGTPPNATTPSSTTSEEWNRRVDNFDVTAFVNRLVDIKTNYVIFTVGQNSGHYCSPNSAYDSFVGIQPSKCSHRDLIREIAEAVVGKGIRFIVYVPCSAPDAEAIAVQKLGWKRPADQGDDRLVGFQRKWEEILREWSVRWGHLVSGWWIDGCYVPAMYRHCDAPNFGSFSAALRAGNPDAIIAFNEGTAKPFDSMSTEMDYTAGEVSELFPVDNEFKFLSRFIDGSQYHVLSYLGGWWSQGIPRFEPEFVVGYTRQVNARGGAMTWDVPIGDTGEIPQPFIDQLRRLS